MLLVNDKVTIVATVGSTGNVVTVKAIGSADPDMTRFIAAVVYKTKFKPAVCGGKPCQMDFPFHFDFTVAY